MGSDITYQAFGKNRDEIRLLDIHPASSLEEPLHCTLRHANLRDANFSALSYVWGPENVNRSDISITYKTSVGHYLKTKFRHDVSRPPPVQNVTIGSNLAGALRCLRQHYPSGITIWADALCINQADNNEKSRQVLLMVRIYSNAKKVLAWLGPHHTESPNVIDQVNAAFDLAESVWKLVDRSLSDATEENWLEACFTVANTTSFSSKQNSTQSQRIGAEFANKLRSAIISNPSLHDGLVAVKALSRTEYFSRIWILQETGRARSLIFHYAQRRIAYRPIFLLLCLASSLRSSQEIPRLQTGLRDLDNRFLSCLTARMTCVRGASLKDVLGVAYLAAPPLHQAKRPEDLIYGRLGLARDASGIDVDYSLSVPQVYTIAARFLLTEGFLNPLTVFKPYKYLQGPNAESLPSWAYDWQRKGLDTFDRFRASKATPPDITFVPFSYPKFHQALRMTGIPLGHIKGIGKRFSALVLEAGLSKDVFMKGSARSESATLISAKQSTLTANITRAAQQLGTSASLADLTTLFAEQTYPLASFWCWWLLWILELRTLLGSRGPQSPVSSASASDRHIVELLYREASRILNRHPTGRSFGSTADLHAFLDLLYTSAAIGGSGGRAEKITPFGISVAESFFRSAWGLRPAMLASGRLAYVPESSEMQDEVVVFHGVNAPLVIRRSVSLAAQGKDAYEIVGPAHVCEVMEGQVIDAGLPTKAFVVV